MGISEAVDLGPMGGIDDRPSMQDIHGEQARDLIAAGLHHLGLAAADGAQFFRIDLNVHDHEYHCLSPRGVPICMSSYRVSSEYTRYTMEVGPVPEYRQTFRRGVVGSKLIGQANQVQRMLDDVWAAKLVAEPSKELA